METLNRNSGLTTSQNGLTQEEAQRRLTRYGYNELAEKTINPLVKFLTYFWGPIPWMIEAAAVLSALVRDWTDFVIIIVLLVTNSAVGFWEEYQAGNAIAALKARLALQARVRRDGSWRTVPARELVPGDLIRLRLGDIVPADATLSIDDPLEVDQSALTGESLPVTCTQGNLVYSGSIIRQGESDALVAATGQNTYFGKTARLVEEAPIVSHFQRAVLKIGDYLIVGDVDPDCRIVSPRCHAHDAEIRTRVDGCGYSCGDADCVVSHHGSWGSTIGSEAGHREPPGGDRGIGGHGYAVFRQNRYFDTEYPDARRTL